MKALRYFLYVIFFGAVFVLAVNNTAAVPLHLPMGLTYVLPQIVWLMVFFIAGVVINFLAFLPRVWHLKGDVRRLTREKTDIFNQKTRADLRIAELEEELSTVNSEKISKSGSEKTEVLAV